MKLAVSCPRRTSIQAEQMRRLNESADARLSSDDPAGPTRSGQRVIALDVLRGFALLGILVLNIESFSGPEALHDIPIGTGQPTFVGWHAGLDVGLLTIKWLFFEGKMRTLFAMLYGAGIVLLTERLEQRGQPGLAADIFRRRNLWLLLFGVLHGTLIWQGDILSQYALVALLFMFPLRHVRARRLILLGTAVALVGGTIGVARFMEVPEVLAQEQLRTDGQLALNAHRVPTSAQSAALEAARNEPQTVASHIAASVAARRLPYLRSIAPRAERYYNFVSALFRSGWILEILGTMLLGMGLYKSGFLTGARSSRAYLLTAAVGYAISVPTVLLGITMFTHDGFSTTSAARWIYPFYEVEVLPAAIANGAVLLLIVRNGWVQSFARALANVGRTAFTNYIFTSVLCQFLFSWGPWKLYGQLAYYEQVFVIAGIWIVNLIASAVWLRFFAYGPLEWMWRSLVYWRWQPFRSVDIPRLSA
jgi:uncharacterized protein